MKQVYFLRPVGQTGPIKIGCSRWPRQRLDVFLSWSPVELEIAAMIDGGFDLERRLHGIFSSHRIRHEWFRPVPELVALIDGLIAGRAIGEFIDLAAPVIRLRRPRSLTDSDRLRLSYIHRLRWAFYDIPFRQPSDAREIMCRWSGWHPHNQKHHPTDAEIARLDAVIAQPKKYGARSQWLSRRPTAHREAA